jgi:hypothetical protein
MCFVCLVTTLGYLTAVLSVVGKTHFRHKMVVDPSKVKRSRQHPELLGSVACGVFVVVGVH